MTIKVLVVDDAVVIRRILVDIINADPDLEVIGTASNGRLALGKIEALQPDLVTLDVEMPELDGLETLVEIRKIDRRLPVIMFSTLTARGARVTLDALSAGASDYITKPSNVGRTGEAIAQVTSELLPRIKALAAPKSSSSGTVELASERFAVRSPAPVGRPVDAVVIGSSTGGPVALETVLESFRSPLHVPVFIAQHMPPVFTGLLAERLDKKSGLTVVEADHGMIAAAGTAYIAPGGRHMIVKRSGTDVVIELHDGPLVNFCRPSVDVLFESAADVYGGRQLAVVLTGMGQDGLVGAQGLATLGTDIIAQDEDTSVVWGMPGAVVGAGLATSILPLDQIGTTIHRRIASTTLLTRQAP